MSLLRHFRRGTFGAAAGALVLPFALFGAALAVGLGGGGLGGLGQIASGPAAPPDTVLSSPSAPRRSAGRLLARVRPAPAVASPAVGGPSTGGTAAGEGGGGARPQVVGIGGLETSVETVRPAPTAPASPQPAATPAATPASAVRQVGDTVKGVTNQVPVVGTPVGQVVDDVVDTVDSLTP